MGLTSDRLQNTGSTGGLTSQRLSQPQEPKKQGILTTLLQSAVSPFARMSANVAGIGEGIAGTGAELLGKATGFKRLEEAGTRTAERMIQPKDFGILGQPRPIGYQDGQAVSVPKFIAEAGGVGLEARAALMGGGGAVQAGKLAFKEILIQGFKEAFKTGLKTGSLYGLGTSLQKEATESDKTLGERAKDVLINTAAQGLLGGLTGGAFATGSALLGAGARRVGEFVSPVLKEKRISSLIQGNADKIRRALNLNRTQRVIESRSGKDVSTFLAEEDLIPSVSQGKLEADDIITSLEAKARAENLAFGQLLDDSGAYVRFDDLKRRTLSSLEGFGTTIESEKNALIKELDSLASQFKNAPKDKKGGLLIPSSITNNVKQFFWEQSKFNRLATPDEKSRSAIFRKLGGTIADLIEDSVDDVNIKGFNQRLGDIQNATYMLSERNGMTIRGGLLGRYLVRTLGAIAGAKGGPLGFVGGAITADKLADVLQDPKISTSIARQYLKALQKEGKESIIEQAYKILEQRSLERSLRPQLNAPSFIPLGEKTGVSGIVKNAPKPTVLPTIPPVRIPIKTRILPEVYLKGVKTQAQQYGQNY